MPGNEEDFNATQNDGKILGFPPGKITAEVLNLFMIPKEVQEKVREPIDNTADYVQKLLHDAKNTLKTWAIRLTFSPILILYSVACGCSWTLLVLLVGDIGYSWLRKQVLPKTRLPYRLLPILATFCLFIGTIIVLIIGAIAKIMNIAASIFKITVGSGSGFGSMSWASLLIMVIITVGIRGVHCPSSALGGSSEARNFLNFGKRRKDRHDEIAMSHLREVYK